VEIREITPPDTGTAFRAMHALRTKLSDSEGFAKQVDEVLRPEGYRLAGAFEGSGEDALGVAGFHIAHSISWGRYLYVDDLSTAPEARRRGCAGGLLAWLLEEAKRQDCEQFHLDSGVIFERVDAHRLYFNAGLWISAHHFARDV
jgi:GNAT superfamily N-acetyltransferase